MKTLLVALALLLTPCLLQADEESHRQAANQLLDLTNAGETMKLGFGGMVEPMLAQMKQRGAPDAAIDEIREAMKDWVNTEIKWEDLQPQIVSLYVKEFTEPELRELVTFYQTPTGKKALERLPVIFQQSAEIGQKYAQTKSASLQARVQKIVEKYKGDAKAGK